VLELYHHGTSVCAAKVRLVLAEKEIEWRGRYVDILAGEQFAPEFLKISPKGVVPILLHDDDVIRESTVINEYLDETFPGPPLRPDAPLGRAAMRLWTKLVDEALHPACGAITFAVSHRYTVLQQPEEKQKSFVEATPDPAMRERKRLWLDKGIDAPDVRDALLAYDRAIALMDRALCGRTWLAGDRYSLADIAMVPYVNRLAMLGMSDLWVEARPRVAAWFERVMARPSFAPAVESHIPAQLGAAMRANGARSWPEVHALLARVPQ
jgi:ganglioside-induced differentiation-associated protein 1